MICCMPRGLVALFCRCYNALTVWPTGNRLPLGSAALAPEKTLRRSSPTFIKKLATPWSLSNWLNSLRPLGRAAKRPNGTPLPRSAFAAPTGKPRHRKLPHASADRLPRSRLLHPTIFRLLRLFCQPLNRACRLNRPPRTLKRLSLPLRRMLLLLSPTRRPAVRHQAPPPVDEAPEPRFSRVAEPVCPPRLSFESVPDPAPSVRGRYGDP